MYMMTMKPGVKPRKKAAFIYDDMPAELAADTVIGLRCVSCNIAKLAAFQSFFSKEIVREKFQIALEKVVVTEAMRPRCKNCSYFTKRGSKY